MNVEPENGPHRNTTQISRDFFAILLLETRTAPHHSLPEGIWYLSAIELVIKDNPLSVHQEKTLTMHGFFFGSPFSRVPKPWQRWQDIPRQSIFNRIVIRTGKWCIWVCWPRFGEEEDGCCCLKVFYRFSRSGKTIARKWFQVSTHSKYIQLRTWEMSYWRIHKTNTPEDTYCRWGERPGIAFEGDGNGYWLGMIEFAYLEMRE